MLSRLLIHACALMTVFFALKSISWVARGELDPWTLLFAVPMLLTALVAFHSSERTTGKSDD